MPQNVCVCVCVCVRLVMIHTQEEHWINTFWKIFHVNSNLVQSICEFTATKTLTESFTSIEELNLDDSYLCVIIPLCVCCMIYVQKLNSRRCNFLVFTTVFVYIVCCHFLDKINFIHYLEMETGCSMALIWYRCIRVVVLSVNLPCYVHSLSIYPSIHGFIAVLFCVYIDGPLCTPSRLQLFYLHHVYWLTSLC